MFQVADPVSNNGIFLGVAVPGLFQLKPTQFLLLGTALANRKSGLLDPFFVSVFDLCHFGLQFFPEVALRFRIVGADHNFIHKGEGL